MQDFLQRFPAGKIDVVRTDYSDMTLGAIDAIKHANRTELLGYLVGEGGYKPAFEAVVAGEIARETQTPPYFGTLVVDNAIKIFRGEAVPPVQTVPIKVFDADKGADAKAYLQTIAAAGTRF
jgi:ABC-type sugar transport system substrate-binding protein